MVSMGFGLTLLILPTKPSSSDIGFASSMEPSIPDKPIAFPPRFSIDPTSDLFTKPVNTAITI